MNGRNLDGNRGLTPVVGIVLLVAITLLLASTVAAFAFGLGEDQRSQRVPTVAFEVEYDHVSGGDDVLRIVHQSGQPVATENLYVDVDGATCSGGADPNGRFNVASDLGRSGNLASGQAVTLDGSPPVTCPGGNLNLRGATVKLVWATETGPSSMLRSWSGPG